MRHRSLSKSYNPLTSEEGVIEFFSHRDDREPLSGEFPRTRIREVKRRDTGWVSDETGWLLLKTEQSNDEDGELKAWMCWGVDEVSLEEVVSWAQLRWCVEQFHRDIKQNLGADEYQGRTWRGVHHHR